MDERNHIWEELKQARLTKGYTLDDVQQLTKIQKHYLIAIEENKLEELPGDFFVKAFIRQYAEVLGMTINETELPKTNTDVIATHLNQKETSEVPLPKRADLKRSSKETDFTYSSSSHNNLPTFLMVLLLILVLGMIWFYFFFMRDNSNGSDEPGGIINQSGSLSIESLSSEPANDEDETAVESSEEDNSDETVVNRDETVTDRVQYKSEGLTLPTQAQITIDSSGSSWVRVTLDEAVVFEGTIAAGSSQEIAVAEGTKEMAIRIGYLPSTTVSIDGQEIEKPEDSQTNQTQTLYINFNE